MDHQPVPTATNRTEPIRLTEGMTVEAADGVFGELADLIIDPIRRHVTHLVVQPLHRHDQARLVPLDAVATSDGHLMLAWSSERIRHTKPIEETEFVRLGHWAHSDPVGTSATHASSPGRSTAPEQWD